VKVQYERDRAGRWITATEVKVNNEGRITALKGYLIKPGDLPLDFKAGNPLTAP
jgi:hypothetical protein